MSAYSSEANVTVNAIQGTTTGITALQTGLVSVNNQIQEIGNAITAQGNIMDTMIASIGVTLGSLAIDAANAFGEVEQSMKIVQMISQATSGDIRYLTEQANQLSVQYRLAIDDITEGLQTLGRAGLHSAQEQTEVLENGLQTAKLEGRDLNGVLEELIQNTALLGGNLKSADFGEQTDYVNDLLVATSLSAPIDTHAISETLKYSGGMLAAAGGDINTKEGKRLIEDYMGAVAAFAQKGVSGSVAGTALRAFFNKPATQDSSVLEGLSQIHLNPEYLWEDGGERMKPVSEQIGLIQGQMDKLNVSTMDQMQIWSKIVGGKMGQQMMKLDSSSIKELTNDIQNSASAEELATKSMQTFESAVKQMEQVAHSVFRGFGGEVAKALYVPIKLVTHLLELLNNPVGATLLFTGFVTILKKTLQIGWRFVKTFAQDLKNILNQDAGQTGSKVKQQIGNSKQYAKNASNEVKTKISDDIDQLGNKIESRLSKAMRTLNVFTGSSEQGWKYAYSVAEGSSKSLLNQLYDPNQIEGSNIGENPALIFAKRYDSLIPQNNQFETFAVEQEKQQFRLAELQKRGRELRELYKTEEAFRLGKDDGIIRALGLDANDAQLKEVKSRLKNYKYEMEDIDRQLKTAFKIKNADPKEIKRIKNKPINDIKKQRNQLQEEFKGYERDRLAYQQLYFQEEQKAANAKQFRIIMSSQFDQFDHIAASGMIPGKQSISAVEHKAKEMSPEELSEAGYLRLDRKKDIAHFNRIKKMEDKIKGLEEDIVQKEKDYSEQLSLKHDQLKSKISLFNQLNPEKKIKYTTDLEHMTTQITGAETAINERKKELTERKNSIKDNTIGLLKKYYDKNIKDEKKLQKHDRAVFNDIFKQLNKDIKEGTLDQELKENGWYNKRINRYENLKTVQNDETGLRTNIVKRLKTFVTIAAKQYSESITADINTALSEVEEQRKHLGYVKTAALGKNQGVAGVQQRRQDKVNTIEKQIEGERKALEDEQKNYDKELVKRTEKAREKFVRANKKNNRVDTGIGSLEKEQEEYINKINKLQEENVKYLQPYQDRLDKALEAKQKFNDSWNTQKYNNTFWQKTKRMPTGFIQREGAINSEIEAAKKALTGAKQSDPYTGRMSAITKLQTDVKNIQKEIWSKTPWSKTPMGQRIAKEVQGSNSFKDYNPDPSTLKQSDINSILRGVDKKFLQKNSEAYTKLQNYIDNGDISKAMGHIKTQIRELDNVIANHEADMKVLTEGDTDQQIKYLQEKKRDLVKIIRNLDEQVALHEDIKAATIDEYKAVRKRAIAEAAAADATGRIIKQEEKEHLRHVSPAYPNQLRGTSEVADADKASRLSVPRKANVPMFTTKAGFGSRESVDDVVKKEKETEQLKNEYFTRSISFKSDMNREEIENLMKEEDYKQKGFIGKLKSHYSNAKDKLDVSGFKDTVKADSLFSGAGNFFKQGLKDMIGTFFSPIMLIFEGVNLISQTIQQSYEEYSQRLGEISKNLDSAIQKRDQAETSLKQAYESEHPDATSEQKNDFVLATYNKIEKEGKNIFKYLDQYATKIRNPLPKYSEDAEGNIVKEETDEEETAIQSVAANMQDLIYANAEISRQMTLLTSKMNDPIWGIDGLGTIISKGFEDILANLPWSDKGEGGEYMYSGELQGYQDGDWFDDGLASQMIANMETDSNKYDDAMNTLDMWLASQNSKSELAAKFENMDMGISKIFGTETTKKLGEYFPQDVKTMYQYGQESSELGSTGRSGLLASFKEDKPTWSQLAKEVGKETKRQTAGLSREERKNRKIDLKDNARVIGLLNKLQRGTAKGLSKQTLLQAQSKIQLQDLQELADNTFKPLQESAAQYGMMTAINSAYQTQIGDSSLSVQNTLDANVSLCAAYLAVCAQAAAFQAQYYQARIDHTTDAKNPEEFEDETFNGYRKNDLLGHIRHDLTGWIDPKVRKNQVGVAGALAGIAAPVKYPNLDQAGINKIIDYYGKSIHDGKMTFDKAMNDLTKMAYHGYQDRLRDMYFASDIGEGDDSGSESGGGGSGGGGSGGGGSSDKSGTKKDRVDLVLCSKKQIPKLDVNLFKKAPQFTILNKNFRLRDIKISTKDKPKAVLDSIKNAIIDTQQRMDPKIIQDEDAEYNPAEATDGKSLPAGSTNTSTK